MHDDIHSVEVSHNVYQINVGEGEYIFYADRGDLFNSITGEHLQDGVADLEEAEYLLTYDFVG